MHSIINQISNNATAEAGQLKDLFARTISYLRVSLTDQCNLRCVYCTPKGSFEKLSCCELLRYEELLRIIGLAVDLGIKKIRLTGGEPLVRRDVLGFIRQLTAIPGLDDVRLTTNGVLLNRCGEDLFEAGIRKLNISLDTLRPERYQEITGRDRFQEVWTGIERVEKIGFSPIKINLVALRGVNDDEFVNFAKLTLERDLQVRFIEFMPMGGGSGWSKDRYISSEEIMDQLAELGDLHPVKRFCMDGPARIFRFKQARGSLGFISPISHQFCDRCNRLRLTSEGRLRSCLLSDKETDIKKILREHGSDEQIRQAIVRTILDKPKGHTLLEKGPGSCHGQMSRIGG